MLHWDIYQVNSGTQNLIGVKFRGTLRKYSLDNDIVLLAENAQDEENTVRFTLVADTYEVTALQEKRGQRKKGSVTFSILMHIYY